MEKGYKEKIEEYKAKGLASEKIMWASIELLDREILTPLSKAHKDLYWRFMRDQHELFCGCHYDEPFALYDVMKLSYIDDKGIKHYMPKWSIEEITPIYNKIKSTIDKTYNVYDFYVTMNMIYSDNYMLYKKWFPDDDDDMLTEKVIEESVNYLNDSDYGNIGKIWRYMRSK